MNELKVPMRRVDVEVLTELGEQVHGCLFAVGNQEVEATTQVTEILNDEREFLPIGIADHENRLIPETVLNKDHILRVHVDAHEPESPEGFVRDLKSCNLLLTDGSRISGQLAVATPATSSRLVDKLNLADRFLLLVSDGGVDFINRRHIVRVN